MPLVFHLGNSQASVYRTIGATLVFSSKTDKFVNFANLRFQASNHLWRFYSPVCVGLVGNPEDRFAHAAHIYQRFLNLGNVSLQWQRPHLS